MTHRDDLLAPAATLEFSDDLRLDDIEPLDAFLAARLGEIASAQPEGTDGRWAADHLAATIADNCRTLSDDLVSWEIEPTGDDTREPAQVRRLSQRLWTNWNRLMSTAERFANHPDYLPRWRSLRYTSVGHAEFVEQTQGDQSDGGILHSATARRVGRGRGHPVLDGLTLRPHPTGAPPVPSSGRPYSIEGCGVQFGHVLVAGLVGGPAPNGHCRSGWRFPWAGRGSRRCSCRARGRIGRCSACE
ncbi:hypothetical protein ACIO1C_00895 [Streptomyces sp. NPDC087420]|uniref:hypothetical protein n=1 Tax=Streptomyces sp. NPDC087420 TaxID=3365785 RepID=UPI003835590C